MIVARTAKQCGYADFGWLQARYTFSFGHYFDPNLLGYAALRVLNQEVLAPGASFQPRIWPRVDILNLVLQGDAEYRDSNGNRSLAQTGDALLIAARPDVSYSEHNISQSASLTRMQIWLDTCPQQENPPQQKIAVADTPIQLLASPDGRAGSLRLRQQAWIHHLHLTKGGRLRVPLHGPCAWLQSIHGTVHALTRKNEKQALNYGDGAFIRDEDNIILIAATPLRALLIDLPV